MIRSINIGITGMKTFQDALSVASNNIANSQTIAHKSQKASFEDLFYNRVKPATRSSGDYAGVNPMTVGSGVRMSSVKNNMAQGSINYTGGKTDVAIEGNGYFMVGNSKGEEAQFTRKGTFQVAGYLTNENGQYVLGWKVNPATGKVDSNTPPKPIDIPVAQALPGKSSTKATIAGNIDFDTKVGEGVRTQFATYDSAGKRTDISMEYVRKDNSTFYYAAIPTEAFVASDSVKSAVINTEGIMDVLQRGDYKIKVTPPVAPATKATINITAPDGTAVLTQQVDNIDQTVTLNDGTRDWGTIDFKKATASNTSTFTVGELGEVKLGVSGTVESITNKSGNPEPTINYNSAATGQPVNVTVNMNEITSYATATSLGVSEVDGMAAASIRDFNIGDDGIIEGQYSDGSVRTIGQVAIATFSNNEGLERTGSGNYVKTVSSGEPRIAKSGEAGAGRVRANSLEASNVDLGQEFVDLMIYQKAFQGNTKIIQVSSEVVDGLINLIR